MLGLGVNMTKIGELVSENQQWLLNYAIPETGMTKQQFCQTAKIKKISDLRRDRYKAAMIWLEQKITQQLDGRQNLNG